MRDTFALIAFIFLTLAGALLIALLVGEWLSGEWRAHRRRREQQRRDAMARRYGMLPFPKEKRL